MFKKIRILLLLLILFFVVAKIFQNKSRNTSWEQTLYVAVYPINADQSEQSQAYIKSLSKDNFKSVENFLNQQAKRFGVELDKPFVFELRDFRAEMPPQVPQSHSLLSTVWWSLKFRYYAWRVASNDDGLAYDFAVFLQLYDPATHSVLDHSTGLEKLEVAIVKGFSSRRMNSRNQVVMAHETLHIIGASDKYVPQTGLPTYPHGYADPDRLPLHPQSKAEIMGGLIPKSDAEAIMPSSLKKVTVGKYTALELRWLKDD